MLYWDDAEVGATCISPTVTVTGAMVDAYADISGDHTPLHTDEAYARASHFGQRVAHGLLGLSLADGLKCQSAMLFHPGMSLGWNWDFKLPIFLDDVLHVRFRVGSKRKVSRPGWGIVVLPTELINQKGEIVQCGEHKLMIPCRPEGDSV